MLHLPSKNQEFVASTDPGSLLSEYALSIQRSWRQHFLLRTDGLPLEPYRIALCTQKKQLLLLQEHSSASYNAHTSRCDCESQYHQHRSVERAYSDWHVSYRALCIDYGMSVVFKHNLLSWSLIRTSLHQYFFCSHAFRFVYNLEKILKKQSPPSAAVLIAKPRNDFLSVASWTSSTYHIVDLLIGWNPFSFQWSMYWLMMVHLATVRTMLGITNSSRSQVWWCKGRKLRLDSNMAS